MPENCLVCVFQCCDLWAQINATIMYALKLSDIWKLACYLRDIWSYWIRSCYPETSKEGHGTDLTFGNHPIPIEYGTIAKNSGFTAFSIFCHISLIEGTLLLCSHTLLSSLISPSCNLTAQRKFCCLVLFRADTKATKTKVKSWSQ